MKKPLDLSQFIGSETRTKIHPRFYLTEGAIYLANEAGAFWLMDAIWSYQPTTDEYFQIWELAVNGTEAVLTMRTDSDQEPSITQQIGYTDFAESTGLDNIKLFAIREGQDCIVLLPSEY